jgi:hypothetical protein
MTLPNNGPVTGDQGTTPTGTSIWGTGNRLIPDPGGIGGYAGEYGSFTWMPPGQGNLVPAEDEQPSRYAFSNENRVLASSLTAIIVGMTDINSTYASNYVDEWASIFYQTNGRWPTGSEALNDPGFTLGAMKLPSGADLLPPLFIVPTAAGPVIYDNSTFAGPVPVEIPTMPTPLAQYVNSSFLQDQGINDQAELEFLLGHQGGVRPGTGGELPLPVITEEQLQAIRDQWTAYMAQHTGGSGSDVKWDRAAIIEDLNNQWRSILLDPPSAGAVETLADQYIREATSFYWQGGNLDLATWSLGKIRETGRYAMLYANKPAHQTEQQYMGGYMNTAEQFGLTPTTTRQETEIGASTGVGLTDFATRLTGSKEYMRSNQGQFSQAFAGMLKGLGAVGRS